MDKYELTRSIAEMATYALLLEGDRSSPKEVLSAVISAAALHGVPEVRYWAPKGATYGEIPVVAGMLLVKAERTLDPAEFARVLRAATATLRDHARSFQREDPTSVYARRYARYGLHLYLA